MTHVRGHGIRKEREFVAPKQLAAKWCVSVSTVMPILRRAEFPIYCLGHGRNGTVRTKRCDMDRYVEICRV